MVKRLMACSALLLSLAACGGSDDSSASSEDATTQTQAPAVDGGSDTTPAPSEPEGTEPDDGGDDGGGDAGGSGPSTATATIGGETYEFSTEGAVVAQCKTDLFGVFIVQLPGVDGDSGIKIFALRDGTDPAVVDQVNAVYVSAGDEDWIADESTDLFDASDTLQPGMTQVDSVEIDGSTVSGSATFVRQLSLFVGGEPETVTGTFEATCGEERVS